MRVEVYYNLHKHLFSVRHKGKVISHSYDVQLEDVTFAVQKAGSEKVISEGRKNVHAFVRGTLVETTETNKNGTSVTYNPYKYKCFVNKVDGQPRYSAKAVTLTKKEGLSPNIVAID